MAPKILKKAKSMAKDLVKKIASAVNPSNEYVFPSIVLMESSLEIDMMQ
jgi:hypothetical protein